LRISFNFPRAIGLILLLLGAASLLAAIVYSSSVPALTGLGLVFWGIIVSYIQSDEYVKKTILNSTSMTLLTALDETLRTLDCKGKAIYLPPKYLNDPESAKVYVPKLETSTLPSPETTQQLEMQPTQKSPQGILITPAGAELARLLETELGTSLLRINLEDLLRRLPKTLIEDLEIVNDCEIQLFAKKRTEKSEENDQTNQSEIFVKFTTTVYRDTCKRAARLPTIFSNIGCPLSSALAIAFSKATGNPIMIKTQQISEDGETNGTEYTIIEEPVA
jgi:hypothetical protein